MNISQKKVLIVLNKIVVPSFFAHDMIVPVSIVGDKAGNETLM